MVTVYGLFLLSEPEKIRYVGQTRRTLEERFSNHLKFRRSRNTHPIQRWLKKHRGNVGIRSLVQDAIWNVTEIETIKKFREQGTPLLNVSTGGNGGNLGPAVCQKIKEKVAIFSKDPEYRKKLSAAAKKRPNRKQREETKIKISKSLTGRQKPENSDPVFRQKLSRALTGLKKSKEHREALSAARIGMPGPRKGIPRSPEVREKIRQALLGRKLSNEHRLAITNGLLRRSNG